MLFRSLLELYKEGQVRFEQVVALGELQVSWVGAESGMVGVSDEFDRPVILENEGEGQASNDQ